MLLPIVWMKEYLDLDIDIKELIDKLNLTGTHVESVMNFGENLNNIIVAKVIGIKKHPNADKLLLVKIFDGIDNHEIITGAKNMKVGDFVVYAKLGAILPNGLEIKPIILKGIESRGMLCSYEELGFEDKVIPKKSSDGVIILKDAVEGKSIVDLLQIKDPVIDLEITPNRSDCLSITGVTREVGASFNKTIKLPKIEINKEVDNILNYIDSIEIKSSNCSRYVGKVVKDIIIRESPQWIQNYLMQAGMRPINNIVDITNFVLLEIGQPIHAFDINSIEDKKILIRQANDNEIFKTLDNSERKLTDNDLVIADGKRAVALAGVMGGLNSEITKDTKTILIESAVFDADAVRKTSKRLNLKTEASQRFEKKLSPEICKYAAERVCQLIEMTNSGTVVSGIFDIYKEKQKDTVIETSTERINNLLGTNISKESIINYFEVLEFRVEDKEQRLLVSIPSFRLDISIEEDLVEEVGRLYGFHNIKPQPIHGPLIKGSKSNKRNIEDETKSIMYALGLFEATTYSFISRKSYDKSLIEFKENEIVKIKNPLGEDFSVMRTTLIPNILNVLEKNSNYKITELKIYELGNTFNLVTNGKLPEERKKLTIGLYGKYDFYDLKDIVIIYFDKLGLHDLDFKVLNDDKTYHPGRSASIVFKDKVIGKLGEISFEVAANYNINSRVYISEIDLEEILDYVDLQKKYETIIKYPKIERDIAIVVDKNFETKTIENIIKTIGEGLISKIELFDIYIGEHIAKDKKSLAYRIVFQSSERTLKEEEVNNILEKIINGLENEIGAKLRS